MISKESIKYSLNNIRKSKARSVLTVISILVGIATIFIFVSFGWGLYDYINDFTSSSSADKILIQPKGSLTGIDSPVKLTDDDIRAIENTNGVYEVAGIYMSIAQINQDDEVRYAYMMGYDPEDSFVMDLWDIDLNSGRGLRRGDAGKVLLGHNYMVKDKIFPKAYSINQKINIQGQDARVLGFYDSVGNPQDDTNIYVTNNFMKDLYPDKNLSYGIIIARVDKNNVPGVADAVKEKLRQERDLKKGKEDFSVETFESLLDSFKTSLNIVIFFILFIALISIVVSAINTANTMITSVLERFKEIGVLKSIGARNREIFKIFLFESGFLGFVAGTVGVILGYGGTELASNILSNLGYGFLSPHYSWVLFLGCVAFATFTGAISGIIPAIHASKINAVDALRYE